MRRFTTALLFVVLTGLNSACAHTPLAMKQEDLVITLKRGACLGPCPAYDVTVYGDRTVVFVGYGATAQVGEKRYHIAPSDVTGLRAFIDKRGFWDLKDKYQVTWTDQVFVDVCMSDSMRKKCVVDYSGLNAGMPQSMRDIEDEIDRVAKTAPLVGVRN